MSDDDQTCDDPTCAAGPAPAGSNVGVYRKVGRTVPRRTDGGGVVGATLILSPSTPPSPSTSPSKVLNELGHPWVAWTILGLGVLGFVFYKLYTKK